MLNIHSVTAEPVSHVCKYYAEAKFADVSSVNFFQEKQARRQSLMNLYT